jgi:hypothetical protein
MSRRQLSLVVVTITSLILTACGTSPTAPRQVKAGAPQLDVAPAAAPVVPAIGTLGSG